MVKIGGKPDIFHYQSFRSTMCENVYPYYDCRYTLSNTRWTSAFLATHTPSKGEDEAHLRIIHKDFPWSTTGWIDIVVQSFHNNDSLKYYKYHDGYIVLVKQNPARFSMNSVLQARLDGICCQLFATLDIIFLSLSLEHLILIPSDSN